MSKKYKVVREDGWPNRETTIAEGDTLEEAIEKAKEKAGMR